MKKFKRGLAALLALTTMVACVGCASTAKEGSFPSKSMNVTVPFGVGGAVDTNVRLISQYLEKELGQTMVINNKTGAGGAIAATEYLGKKSDPHEIFVSGISLFTIAPLFNKDIKFTLDDFKPVAGIVSDVFILYANPKASGIESFEDLLAYGKDNKVIFGSNAPGGTTHLLQAALFKKAGINADAVPGDSNFVDMTNLLGGHVDVTLAPPNVGAENIKEGSIIPIAVFSETPYTGFEGIEVPTVKSFGYDIVFESSNFFMVRGDTDQAVVDTLYDAIIKVYDNTDFAAQAEKSNYVPSRDNGEALLVKIEDSAKLMKELYDVVYE